jgi:DNA-binding MarR family transcriptional regulator
MAAGNRRAAGNRAGAEDAGIVAADLDPVIHAPARLRIMVSLAALADGDRLSFPRLQQLLGLTAGNLITHLRRLEEVGYVASAKAGVDGTGRTSVSLTHAGRAALDRYRATLLRLLDHAAGPAQ